MEAAPQHESPAARLHRAAQPEGLKSVPKSRPAANCKDLTGRKYGRLTVIEATQERDYRGSVMWKCKCRCGGEKLVSSPNLRRGLVVSCGCAKAEQKRIAMTGMRETQEELKAAREEILWLKARIQELEEELPWAHASL